MRSGTSKGIFFHRHQLPPHPEDWSAPLLAAMGSSCGDPRQIDGVGGGSSTTSKVAVVSPSKIPGVDVEYTFVQVAVGKNKIDLSGNCGNIASGVGPFAVQEGLVKTTPGQKTLDVRVFNTNTSQHLVETLELDEMGQFQEEGDFQLPGVREYGSKVQVAFKNPEGSLTGALFPTGRKVDTLCVQSTSIFPAFTIEATLIDAANPFVFVDSTQLAGIVQNRPPESQEYKDVIEEIRRIGAVMMGLAPDTMTAAATQGTPKIAIVSRPEPAASMADIRVLSFSMGSPHSSLQLTGAVTLGAAICIPGTIPHRLSPQSSKERSKMQSAALPTPERTPSPLGSFEPGSDKPRYENEAEASDILDCEPLAIHIEHGKGVMPVEVKMKRRGQPVYNNCKLEYCTVFRTVRRLFEGSISYYC
ncbi:hypothetical protein PFICI_10499 [Pestalotiopsis fici W106-1]|uniref:Methylitaconate delta2-delta3-isomerase n=1 Tax=Pestalotiopsis fici (strain W106-1 / CGMCC3.15140) TaxID=1229662 RepID=W3WZ86_PESFW|nr:uncharacterized protein PFICI_10499 [Pestalotiopsis fici W106-1]ETS78437.1 hypothetical protein PFICI_10499 [Pestalotiopsis fici W106-1]